jgi:nicotinate-nucleotide adenylyltransferase
LKPLRIGIFGGTFDPVHWGHLQLAHQAIKEIGLSQLLFVPAAAPPHKNVVIASMDHREAMLELICRDSAKLVCSNIESKLPKPSYTVDTLTVLKKSLPLNSDLFFIIGADAFLDLMTWKSYRSILTMVQIVVSPRVGYSEQLLYDFLLQIGYFQKDGQWQAEGENKDITILSKSPHGVCSSDFRKGVVKGGDMTTFLPPEVAKYIQENSLYNL